MSRALVLLSILSACAPLSAQVEDAASRAPAQASAPEDEAKGVWPATDPALREGDPATNAPSSVQLSEETHIRSETVDLGIKTRTAIYRGNVRLDDPRLHLTCEYLFANIPETGQVDHIIAETNVVIELLDDKGLTNWAYADKAVYTYTASATETNEMVELTGSPRLERKEGILYGDTIIWDRARNDIRATNQRMVPRRESPPVADTNATPEAASPPAEGALASPDSPADE